MSRQNANTKNQFYFNCLMKAWTNINVCFSDAEMKVLLNWKRCFAIVECALCIAHTTCRLQTAIRKEWIENKSSGSPCITVHFWSSKSDEHWTYGGSNKFTFYILCDSFQMSHAQHVDSFRIQWNKRWKI